MTAAIAIQIQETDLATQKPRVSFAIDGDLKQALEDQAAKESRTTSNLIVVAIKEYLERAGKLNDHTKGKTNE
jgi:predicted transcriptional regulator